MSRVGAALAVWLLRIYQLSVSTLLGPACRFEPSCSNYAIDAIDQLGVRKGLWLAGRRLLRCHPCGGSGYDPVSGRMGDGS